jgi:hypothetical protein
MGEPLTTLCVFDQIVGDDNYRLDVSLTDDDGLLISGHDAGPGVGCLWQGSDRHTYWVCLDKADKDSMLLHLLRERYRDRDFEIMTWLKSRGIPFAFMNCLSFE